MKCKIVVKYTNTDNEPKKDIFDSERNSYFSEVTNKMAYIAECHLTDSHADFTKPITIRYIPFCSEQT